MATRTLKNQTLQADRHTLIADTSSADVTFDGIGLSLYIGGAGNITIEALDGTQVLYSGLLAGSQIYPPLFQQIESTNSTATNVVVIWRSNPAGQ